MAKPLRLDPDELTRELADMGGLTAREQEVVRLLLLGESNHRVAIRLGLKPRTVKFHRSNALEKLCAESLRDVWSMLFEVSGFKLGTLEGYEVDWVRLLGGGQGPINPEVLARATDRTPEQVKLKLIELGYADEDFLE